MAEYFYKCFECGSEFSSEYIESNLIYLCEKCGSSKANQPLLGVLTVQYDYAELKQEIRSADFIKSRYGRIADYKSLLPLKKDAFNIPYPELFSSIERVKFDNSPNEIFIMDESRNPTLSFKDRASLVVALKAIELGIDEISAASTGNAGSSLAGISARLGLKSHIFVPENIPKAKRLQIESFGAILHIVQGDYDLAFDECLKFSNKYKIYNRNTAFNPLTIEGKKTASFDMFIHFGKELPDNIIIPVGDGVILSGIYKGFSDLLNLGLIEKIPNLIAVQAKGSNALYRFMSSGKFEFIPAKTIADSISAGAPRNLYMAADSISRTNGNCFQVSDGEITIAQSKAAKIGYLIEPSCASVLAAYDMLQNKNYFGSNGQKILLLFTGNGLKDIDSLSNLLKN